MSSKFTNSQPTIELKVNSPTANLGITGPRGPVGPANTLSIGTVTKGTEAAATITGAAPNQTLNLVLPKGDKGKNGYTPVKGLDYFTDADKQELIQDVLSALPNAEEGNF